MLETQSKVRNSPVMYWALLLLLVWLPLPYGSNQTWSWAFMEIWIYLMSAVWLWKFAGGKVRITPAFLKAKPVLILFVLWLVYGLLQIVPISHDVVEVLSPKTAELYSQLRWENNAVSLAPTAALHPMTLDVQASITAWMKSLGYVLLFSLTLLLVDSRQRLKTLAYVLVFSGLVQALYGSLIVLGSGGGVVSGTFFNRNHFAGYIVLCLAIGIGLLLASMGRTEKAVTWRRRLRHLARVFMSSKASLRIILALLVIALILTYSRMGNVSFFASMLIAGIGALILFKGSPRPTLILITSLIIIDVIIIGSWVGLERVVQRIEETSLVTAKRDDLDVYTWEMVKDYPVFGTGAGSFYSTFPQYREEGLGEKVFDHAHNDYLQLLSEYGTVGGALLSLVVMLSIWKALVAQRKRRDALMRGLGFAVVMGSMAVLIHATVEFNLQIPAYTATFIVLLAIAWLVPCLGHREIADKRTLTEGGLSSA